MAQSVLLCVLFLFAYVSLNLAQKNPAKKDCSKCDPSTCPELTTICQAGVVKDVCDCCTVCGRKEGETCDVEVVNDEKQYFQKPFYSPVQGKCGEGLKCFWVKDNEQTNSVTDYATCMCNSHKAVCGEDGKTYKNKCVFSETMAGRREQFRIVRDEPCDEAPKFVSTPQSLEEISGEDVLLSCEVSGFPPAKIEWTFKRADGVVLPMPNDDVRKSVQTRGGPGPYQVTGWLQLQALEVEDSGVYTCIGRNKLGKISADATLVVNRKNGEL